MHVVATDAAKDEVISIVWYDSYILRRLLGYRCNLYEKSQMELVI